MITLQNNTTYQDISLLTILLLNVHSRYFKALLRVLYIKSTRLGKTDNITTKKAVFNKIHVTTGEQSMSDKL